MTVCDYGYTPLPGEPEGKGIPARVTAARGGYFHIVCDSGQGVARLKASAYRDGREPPVTGDFVRLEWNPVGESRILQTLPRKSCFKRLDPSSSGRQAQVIAANFDFVFLLMSLNQNFNVRRLERYLALTWESGAKPVVVLTKTDLLRGHKRFLREAGRVVADVPVHAVSAKTGAGLEELSPFVQPRTTFVLLGSSGVGKSSLINALAGEEWMPTMEIREWDGKGRHTTTERELVMLPNGAMAIDTPGVRELGLWDAAGGVERTFADVEAFFGHCKFSDCRHETEPGCAVRDAIASGKLSRERWEAYQRLLRETALQESMQSGVRHARQTSTHRFRRT